MSTKAQKIKERFLKGYVTDEQLIRYEELNVITHEEYVEIYESKYPPQEETEEQTEEVE